MAGQIDRGREMEWRVHDNRDTERAENSDWWRQLMAELLATAYHIKHGDGLHRTATLDHFKCGEESTDELFH